MKLTVLRKITSPQELIFKTLGVSPSRVDLVCRLEHRSYIESLLSLSRLRHSKREIRHQGRPGGHHLHRRLPLLLQSFPIITKISDTRRDSNIIKEAVINIFDFLFSSLSISHTNLCEHEIKKIQTTEVFTGNSKRRIDIAILPEEKRHQRSRHQHPRLLLLFPFTATEDSDH